MKIWNRIRKEFRKELGLWSLDARPGIMVLILIVLIRMTGGLQSLEYMFFDTMLRIWTLDKKKLFA